MKSNLSGRWATTSFRFTYPPGIFAFEYFNLFLGWHFRVRRVVESESIQVGGGVLTVKGSSTTSVTDLGRQ